MDGMIPDIMSPGFGNTMNIEIRKETPMIRAERGTSIWWNCKIIVSRVAMSRAAILIKLGN
jgi:hypothetical protein